MGMTTHFFCDTVDVAFIIFSNDEEQGLADQLFL